MSFGARLREARERQRISLLVIAEQTKIKLSLLEALERDDLSYWPGGIFRRAWVREYAQRVGLDPDATVREFLTVYPEEEETPEMLASARVGAGQRAPTRLRFLLGSALDALSGLRGGAAPGPGGGSGTGGSATGAASTGGGSTSGRPGGRPAGVPSGVTLSEPLSWADDRPAEVPPVPRESDFQLTHPPDDASVALMPLTAHASVPPLDLTALASLCLRLSCATELAQVAPVLDSARGLLGASGLVLWVRLADEGCAAAVLTSGYPADLLAQLPRVPEQSDIPVARALSSGALQLVAGDADGPGALAMPLLQPSGPVGVFALELPAGLERDPQLQAATRILAAQLASLLAA